MISNENIITEKQLLASLPGSEFSQIATDWWDIWIKHSKSC